MKPNTPKGKDPLKDRLSVDELFNIADTDLHDLHDRLWYEYFTPARKLTKDEANFIRLQLNTVAAHIKIVAAESKNPYAQVILVEPSTKFEMDELGPNSKIVIYTDVAEPLKIISSYKSRIGKIGRNVHPSIVAVDEDLLGDNEDLLGDSGGISRKLKVGKSKKAVDPNKVTATSIYDELAKLANKLGDSADKISKAKPEWPRKCITDALWKWRKTKGGKK
jgi:hypothetical protein